MSTYPDTQDFSRQRSTWPFTVRIPQVQAVGKAPRKHWPDGWCIRRRVCWSYEKLCEGLLASHSSLTTLSSAIATQVIPSAMCSCWAPSGKLRLSAGGTESAKSKVASGDAIVRLISRTTAAKKLLRSMLPTILAIAR